jgi:hypothetical protein
MNSQKALCKVRRFRNKFRPIVVDDIYDEKIDFDTADNEDSTENYV